MAYKYYLYINDYEVVLQNPVVITSDHAINLGDIVDIEMDGITDELDIEYDTYSFRVVQRRYYAAEEHSAMALTVVPHFDGIQID